MKTQLKIIAVISVIVYVVIFFFFTKESYRQHTVIKEEASSRLEQQSFIVKDYLHNYFYLLGMVTHDVYLSYSKGTEIQYDLNSIKNVLIIKDGLLVYSSYSFTEYIDKKLLNKFSGKDFFIGKVTYQQRSHLYYSRHYENITIVLIFDLPSIIRQNTLAALFYDTGFLLDALTPAPPQFNFVTVYAKDIPRNEVKIARHYSNQYLIQLTSLTEIPLELMAVIPLDPLYKKWRSLVYEGLFSIFLVTVLLIIFGFYLYKQFYKIYQNEVVLRQQAAIFEQMSDGVFVLDNDKKIIAWNKAAEKLFGFQKNEVLGQIPEFLFNKSIDNMDNIYNINVDFWMGEVQYCNKSRKLIDCEVSIIPLIKEGEKISTLFINRDISERKKLERMKIEFISTVSHELRTPLTSIRGSLGIITAGAAGHLPTKIMNLINIAYNNSERLIALVNDILDIQKIENNKIKFDFAKVDLVEVVETAIFTNSPYAHQYSIYLALITQPPHAHVYGDFERLLQVMTNLISNAIKFSPHQGQVDVYVYTLENKHRVEVCDHGPGIPDKYREKIFEKFFQVDSSVSRQKSGTGLGLSICRAIIKRHGGNISFKNDKNKGTMFYFEMDRYKEYLPSKEKLILLCTKDNSQVVNDIKSILTTEGCIVDTATSLKDVINKLLEHYYSALIIDSTVEDINKHLLETLYDYDITVPVIIMSSEKPLVNNVLGIVEWLEHPMDANKLIDLITNKMLSKPESRILYIEDDPDLVKVVSALLIDYAVVENVSTLKQCQEVLHNNHYDLIILDIVLPDGSGFKILEMLEKEALPPIVIFSAYEVDLKEKPELRNKISAILIKSRVSDTQLVDTIKDLISKNRKI